MNRLSEWFIENKLLLKLKPDKTELLLFGTNQRLAKVPKNLEVTYRHMKIKKSILTQKIFLTKNECKTPCGYLTFTFYQKIFFMIKRH